MPTYDPETTALVIDSQPIVGYGEGTFFKASRNVDSFTLKVGADGFWVRNKSANKSGRMEVTLLRSSPANSILQAMADEDEDAGTGTRDAMFKDGPSGQGLVHTPEAWIVKPPDFERAAEDQEVTWVLEGGEVEIKNLPSATT